MTQLTVQESVLSAKWESFLQDYAKAAVQTAAEDYPDTRSVVLEFNEIQLRDPDLADYLLNKPRHCLQIGGQMLQNVDVTVDPKPRLRLRVKGLSLELERAGGRLVPIRGLRVEHLGRFIVVEGLVKKTVDVRPVILQAAWDCRTCGNRVRLEQDDPDEALLEPVICDGCQKKGPWTLRDEECIRLDHQKILLQENPEGLRGQQAATVTVNLYDDLVARVPAGKRARIHGILTPVRKQKDRKPSIVEDQVFQAVHIELLELSLEDVVITPKDEEQLVQLAGDPNVWGRLVASFAPDHHGHDVEKEGLLLGLLSGDATGKGGGARRNSHVLLIGDPATGKSQLLEFAHLLLPRSIYVDVPNATGVGLTAAAVHDDFGGSRWTLDAGAAVMADGAALCLDELDKASPEDLAKILGLLEKNKIEINKVGISTTLPANVRCLAGANPEGSRFDPELGDLYSQVDMRPELLSRFDLAFAMRDAVDHDQDVAIAKAIGRRYQPAAAAAAGQDVVPVELLRKFVASVLRRTPELPDVVVDYLAADYARERDLAKKMKRPVPRNARSMAGAIRLAVAAARAHNRPAVTQADADRALRVMRRAQESLGVVDSQGVIDIDVLVGGVHRSQHDRLRQVHELVRELAKASDRGHSTVDDVVKAAHARHGLVEPEVRKALDTLRRHNSVYAKGGADTVAPLHS